MAEKKSELLRFAREYATANKDLYELLSVSVNATQPEVQRAWRKGSLKHHPDKAVNFDPEMWELFERARDVLSFPEARATYDSTREAAVQAQKKRAALDAKRREMIEDLEARERGVKRKVGEGADARHMMTEAEKAALIETGNEHVEKRRRMKAEAEAKEKEREREQEREQERTRMEAARARGAAQREAGRLRTQSDSGRAPNTFAPTSRDKKVTEDTGLRPSPTLPEDYDERIALLVRVDRERAEKAACAAQKEAGRQRTRSDFDRMPTTSTFPSTLTDNRMTENTGSCPPPRQPLPDDYDERIAVLEGRIQEKKAERAAQKAEQKPTAKARTDGEPRQFHTTTPASARAASTQATSPPKPQSMPPPRPSSSNPAPGDFSSTMAKLRAAQQEKERKKAEDAAATMASNNKS